MEVISFEEAQKRGLTEGMTMSVLPSRGEYYFKGALLCSCGGELKIIEEKKASQADTPFIFCEKCRQEIDPTGEIYTANK